MAVHDRLGIVVAIVAAGGALLAVLSLARPRLLPTLLVYLRLTVALTAVQVLVGLALVAGGLRPAELLHWFYGAATLLTLPIAMVVGRRLGEREQRVWITGGAVLTLLFAFRAISTG